MKFSDYSGSYDIEFTDNSITVNGFSMKVKSDPRREHIVELSKRSSNFIAIDGVDGLRKFISECIDEKFMEAYVGKICRLVCAYGKQI